MGSWEIQKELMTKGEKAHDLLKGESQSIFTPCEDVDFPCKFLGLVITLNFFIQSSLVISTEHILLGAIAGPCCLLSLGLESAYE